MRLSSTIKGALITGAASIVAAVLGVVGGYDWGKTGKKPAFDAIPTHVKLHKTRWEVIYKDVGPARGPVERSAIINFEQFNSRIVGEGQDTSGRKWIVEGATADRRVCYIYYEPGGQRLSFGTVLLEMSNDGKEMNGQWSGWAPEGGKLEPREVKLSRIFE